MAKWKIPVIWVIFVILKNAIPWPDQIVTTRYCCSCYALFSSEVMEAMRASRIDFTIFSTTLISIRLKSTSCAKMRTFVSPSNSACPSSIPTTIVTISPSVPRAWRTNPRAVSRHHVLRHAFLKHSALRAWVGLSSNHQFARHFASKGYGANQWLRYSCSLALPGFDLLRLQLAKEERFSTHDWDQ